MVLDGIDELPVNPDFFTNCLPQIDDLDEGCFIILLSRFPDEDTVDEKSRVLINRIKKHSSQCIEIRRSAPENIEVLDKYIQNRIHIPFVEDRLLREVDYRFLKLKIYSSMDSVDTIKEKTEAELICDYFSSIINGRSNKIRNDAIRLAAAIALLNKISLQQYCECFNNGDLDYPLIGIINDLQPLLTEIRVDGMTYYSYANIEYEKYILETYKNVCQELIKELIQQFKHAQESNLIEFDTFWLRGIKKIFELSDAFEVRNYCLNFEFLNQLQTLLSPHTLGESYAEAEKEQLRKQDMCFFIHLISEYSLLENCEGIKLHQIIRYRIISQYPEDYLKTVNTVLCPVCNGENPSIEWLEFLIYPDAFENSSAEFAEIKKIESKTIISAYAKGDYLDILIDYLCYKARTGDFDSYLEEIVGIQSLNELQKQKVWSAFVISHIRITHFKQIDIEKIDVVDKYIHLLKKAGKQIITLNSDVGYFAPEKLEVSPYSTPDICEIEYHLSGGRSIEQIKKWDQELINNKAISANKTDELVSDLGKEGRILSEVKKALNYNSIPTIDQATKLFLNHYYGVLEYYRLKDETVGKEENYLLKNCAGFFIYMLTLKVSFNSTEFYSILFDWMHYLLIQKNGEDYRTLMYPMFRLSLNHLDNNSVRYLDLLGDYIQTYYISVLNIESKAVIQNEGYNAVLLYYLQKLMEHERRDDVLKLIEETDAVGTMILEDNNTDPEYLICNAGNSVKYIKIKEMMGMYDCNALSYLNRITEVFRQVILETNVQSRTWQFGECYIDRLIDALFRIYYENDFWQDAAIVSDWIKSDFEVRLWSCKDEKERKMLFVYREKLEQIAFFFKYLINPEIQMPPFKYSMQHVYQLYFLDAVMLVITEIKEKGFCDYDRISKLLPDRIAEFNFEKQYWELDINHSLDDMSNNSDQ